MPEREKPKEREEGCGMPAIFNSVQIAIAE